MATPSIEERIASLKGTYWHHTIRLTPDHIMEGGKTAEVLEAERADFLGIVDIAGRSVIDIGTWNGFFAFEAKRAGASRVIATDSFAWQSAAFRGRETFDLARECLGADVEAVEIDPTELPGDLPPVDVVLFLGVFYHMFDPIMVLRKTAELAQDLLIIETHQDLDTMDRPAMVFYPGATLNNDFSNWWGPNPECIVELLAEMDFRHVFYQPRPAGKRGIYHAFRSAETARRYLRVPADNQALFDLASAAGRAAIYGKGVAPLPVPPEAVPAPPAAAPMPDPAIAQLAAARVEIAALRNSTSWRLTAPLRAISSALRGR